MTYQDALAWAKRQRGPWQQRDLRAGLRLNAKLATYYCMELRRKGAAVWAGHATYKTVRVK